MRFANYAANKIEIISSTANLFKRYMFGLNKKNEWRKATKKETSFAYRLYVQNDVGFGHNHWFYKREKINKARRKLI